MCLFRYLIWINNSQEPTRTCRQDNVIYLFPLSMYPILLKMKSIFTATRIIICLFFLGFSGKQLAAQNLPGYINRTATSVAGRAVLDPNGDGFTSATTAGFGAPSDQATSEIAYSGVRSYSTEPGGDISAGPAGGFSDFVQDGSNIGFYQYFNGTNWLFRFRLGSIVAGSKGYSVLIDTDGKFGPSGANADPNYIASTSNTNGNPGFEIEIVLETNSRIAIYNVDGTASPLLVTSYTNWQDMSQISLALTNFSGNPDFFYDFYIPFSVLQGAPFNLTSSSPVRLTGTTVTNPGPAISGIKSDIYGVTDNTNKGYEDFIGGQPPAPPGSGTGTMCTAPPVVFAPIGAGTVTISGNWNVSALAGALTTTNITVFKNGTSVGTVNGVSSGTNWNLTGIAVTNGDVITAKAQSTGESMCVTSNSVFVVGCTPSNTTPTSSATFSVTCVNNRRGMSGTKATNAVVKIYTIAAVGSPILFATDGTPASPSGFSISYGSPSNIVNTTWEYNGSNNSGSTDPCSGGPNDIADGSYYITVTEPGKCESAPLFGSCVNLTSTATPVITQTVLYNGSTTVSGTAVSGSTVRLYVNGVLRATQTAAGVNYSFLNVALNIGDVVQIMAQAVGSCVSAFASRTVTCFTSTPSTTADINNQVVAGAAIVGTSSEPTGTTIRIYNVAGNVLVATTIVQTGGTWTSAPYNAVAGTSYYATAQNATCSVSANSSNISAAATTSAARCGTITGPVAAGATSVSGTLATAVANTTIKMYQDAVLLGSVVTSTTSWTVTGIAAGAIYANGRLTIGVQESGSREVACAVTLSVSCSPAPVVPVFTPTTAVISANQTVTYTVTNAVAGNFYAISNAVTGASLGTGVWAAASGSLNLTTVPISTPGNYSVLVSSTSLTGLNACAAVPAAASLDVTSTLPLHLLQFAGKKAGTRIELNWQTEREEKTDYFLIERSVDGTNYGIMGRVNASGKSSGLLSYLFADEHPADGNNYYRLKMVDTDLKTVYSNVVLVKSANNELLKIWPNPFNKELNLVFNAQHTGMAQLQIHDLEGRQVYNQSIAVTKGVSQIKIKQLTSLLRGIYVIEITEPEVSNKSINKIIKQ